MEVAMTIARKPEEVESTQPGNVPTVPRAVTAARNQKVSRAVARLIVKDIAERRLEPGSALPAEQQMAKQYGVGRSSVREALRLLETQGLVIIRQGLGGGPLVAEPEGRDFGETLTMYLQIRHIRFVEIAEAMAEMDGLAAGMLARRVKTGQVTDLDDLVAAAESELAGLDSDADVIETAVGFHDIMRRMAGNYVVDLVSAAIAHIFTERSLGAHSNHWSREERVLIAKQHRALAQAIRQGHVDRARNLATSHLQEISDLVLKRYPAIREEIVDWR
jgi:DNA-binding FadR family transcriptional regulator